jgi:hypothetical protein
MYIAKALFVSHLCSSRKHVLHKPCAQPHDNWPTVAMLAGQPGQHVVATGRANTEYAQGHGHDLSISSKLKVMIYQYHDLTTSSKLKAMIMICPMITQ